MGARDYAQLAQLLATFGPLVTSLVFDSSQQPPEKPDAVRLQVLETALGRCPNLDSVYLSHDSALRHDDNVYRSWNAASISHQCVARALVPLASRLRRLGCSGRYADLRFYAHAFALLLPSAANLQSVHLPTSGSSYPTQLLLQCARAIMLMAEVRVLTLHLDVLLHADQFRLPHLEPADLYYLGDDPDFPAYLQSFLRSVSATLRHLAIRLPPADIVLPNFASPIVFPRLESLRLCGLSTTHFMMNLTSATPTLRSICVCTLDTDTFDIIRAFCEKATTKSWRELVFVEACCESGGTSKAVFERLTAWATSCGAHVEIEDKVSWDARKLEESQRRAGLRPCFV